MVNDLCSQLSGDANDASFFEKGICCGLRGALSCHFRFQSGDFFLEQANPFAELSDRQQRQILPDLVRDLLLWQFVGIDSGHLRSFANKLAAADAVVTSAPRFKEQSLHIAATALQLFGEA
jgi:hypothetical protein